MTQKEARHQVMLRVPASCRPKAVRDREKHALSESIEEYTEGIYRLQGELEVVSTGDIAKYMSVAPASVTPMLRKLVEFGLIEHTPYQGVRLTKEGEKLSITLIRKHRLLERMLVDFLELPWEDVHELACKLEHYISEDVADRIAKAMNYPKTCPHGNPIDAQAEDGTRRLSGGMANEELVIVKITDERLEFLSYLVEIGLVPDTRIRVKTRSPYGDVLTLEVEGKNEPVAIGRDAAANIWVHDGVSKPEDATLGK